MLFRSSNTAEFISRISVPGIIMAFAAMGKNLAAAVLMLFLFAVGQGLILIIAGLFTSGVKNLKNFAGMSAVLLKVSGVLLILVALYLYYKTFAPLI